MSSFPIARSRRALLSCGGMVATLALAGSCSDSNGNSGDGQGVVTAPPATTTTNSGAGPTATPPVTPPATGTPPATPGTPVGTPGSTVPPTPAMPAAPGGTGATGGAVTPSPMDTGAPSPAQTETPASTGTGPTETPDPPAMGTGEGDTGPGPTPTMEVPPETEPPACGTPLGPREPPPLGAWPPPGIKFTEVSSGTQPTAITAPPCDESRLFFAEKWGIIRVIKDGVLVDEPVLDMRDAVLEGGPYGTEGHGTEVVNEGKRGLVGLAFHPNYEENGRAFVMYTADQGVPGYGTNDNNNIWDDGDVTFAEYRRSADNPDKFDPEPVAVFLSYDKGSTEGVSGQHNGGALYVGVDGFLWASTGDVPPYSDPGAQDLNSLQGKLLRFDISGDTVAPAGNYPGADQYIWSIGIRNAYKFSIDRYTGDIYVGDVGENSWEEITVERYGDGHKNHEWDMSEGRQTFNAFNGCEADNCLPPVYDYGHTGEEGAPGADNCIIGGNVYRGNAIPELQGAYIYSDYGSGKVRALQVVDGVMNGDVHEFGNLSVFAGCFGEDAAGEMYVCDYDNNRILRIDAE